MQGMSLWLILDISFMLLFICLGYICTLACYLTLVGTWMNLNLWDCNSLNLEQSLHHQVSTQWWLKTRKHETIQTYPLANSMLSLMIVILDTQVLFLANLTHVGRWTQTPSGAPNSWWTTSTLSNPHKFNYMMKINTTTQGMLFHLREALLQVMGQSNSARCEYIKMLKRKMVIPLSLNNEYDLWSSDLTWLLSQYTLT